MLQLALSPLSTTRIMSGSKATTLDPSMEILSIENDRAALPASDSLPLDYEVEKNKLSSCLSRCIGGGYLVTAARPVL